MEWYYPISNQKKFKTITLISNSIAWYKIFAELKVRSQLDNISIHPSDLIGTEFAKAMNSTRLKKISDDKAALPEIMTVNFDYMEGGSF